MSRTNSFRNYSCKYIDEIIKYLELASKSNIIKKNADKKLTHLGYRLITHIFQTNLIHTSDLDALFFSMQKGYLYYLEYLEQTDSKSNKDFNQLSTTFIYDKTIIKYTQEDRTIIKLDQTILSMMPRIAKLIETILWLDNNLIQQTGIDFNIVKSICELLHNYEDNLIISFIEFAQKRTMDTAEYNEFLTLVFKIFRTNLKNEMYTERDWEEQMLKKFPDIEDAYKLTVSKWCKWLWF